MKEFRCNEDCELFKGNCGKHHIDYQGHIVWDCPHEQYYTGVLGDVPSCFHPSKEFKEKQRLNKQITIGEMESILDEIKTELYATAEMHDDGDYYLREEWIGEIFDKYKLDSEDI